MEKTFWLMISGVWIGYFLSLFIPNYKPSKFIIGLAFLIVILDIINKFL